MAEHHVKSWTHLFAAFLRGIKTHDMRVMDRPYEVGDVLVLHEYDKQRERYTGRTARGEITYITSRDHSPCAFSPSALDPDYGILSLRRLKDADNLPADRVQAEPQVDHYKPLAALFSHLKPRCPSIQDGCATPDVCRAEGQCHYSGSPFFPFPDNK